MEHEHLFHVASQFVDCAIVKAISCLGEGFINDTFIVETADGFPGYILQRKNTNVFPDIDGMTDNIERVTAHIRRKVAAAGGDADREVMRIVRTRQGHELYHRDESGDCWVMTVLIPDTVTYAAAHSPRLARLGGVGIGRFQRQLADFSEPLAVTLPGFHDMRHRFHQWDESLARDAAGRKASVAAEIEWIESRRHSMLAFHALVEQGVIPKSVAHNDTKISNILFDNADNAVCVIDLDTVMMSTALYDFGDAIRAYANTGAEDDRDTDNVGLSMEMFAAFTEGYLSERLSTLSDIELDNLVMSALYITYEQTLRFLMDYIDGDVYYKTHYAEHNLTRARAQHKLLCDMERRQAEMEAMVGNFRLTGASQAF